MPNEIMNVGIGAQLQNVSNDVYCTARMDTPKEQGAVFNAVNNPEHKLGDVLGKTIRVKDVVAEMVEMEDEETGEKTMAPRIVLIDVNGEAYQCISVGILNALKRLMANFGSPTWEQGLPVIPRQINVNSKNRMYTLDVDVDEL